MIGSSPETRTLEGKTALVTCSSRGIGYAIAEILAGAGAQLLICSRDVANGSLDAARKRLEHISTKPVSAIECDLTEPHGCDRLISYTREFGADGKIDILVYNAPHPSSPSGLESIQSQHLERGISSCVRTPFQLCQALVPKMAKAQWGRVFLLSSCYAMRPSSEFYMSSFLRPGLSNLARLLAQDYAKFGVVANALLLGYYDTSLTRSLPEDALNIVSAKQLTPNNCLPNPSCVGRMISYLCGEHGFIANGTELLLDSGYLASAVQAITASTGNS